MERLHGRSWLYSIFIAMPAITKPKQKTALSSPLQAIILENNAGYIEVQSKRHL